MKVRSKPRIKEPIKNEPREISRGPNDIEKSVLSADIMARLRTLFNAFPFYVMLLDAKHRILLANDKLTKLAGMDSERIIGEYCPKVIHKTLEPFSGCPLEEVVRKGHAVRRELLIPITAIG